MTWYDHLARSTGGYGTFRQLGPVGSMLEIFGIQPPTLLVVIFFQYYSYLSAVKRLQTYRCAERSYPRDRMDIGTDRVVEKVLQVLPQPGC